MSETFFDLKAKTPGGKEVDLSTFRGHPVLVINTATQCGLAPQFEGLEKLHQDYSAKGLKVVGFPCDQFAHQEPVSDDQMEQVCKANHGVTFPLMAKINVNGPETHPVFKHLKAKTRGLFGSDIKWNFTKFLVSPDGKVVKRYAPTTVPEAIRKDIEALLK